MPAKRKSIPLDIKKEVIKKLENGACVIDIAEQLKISKPTISTILKQKGDITEADVARGVTILSK